MFAAKSDRRVDCHNDCHEDHSDDSLSELSINYGNRILVCILVHRSSGMEQPCYWINTQCTSIN